MRIQEFDFSVDLLRNLLWEYNEATSLQSLISQKQDWYIKNHTQFWNDWMVDVFDLNTANDFGLSVWSIILNIPLVVAQEPDPDKVAFGFGPDRANFNNGNFMPTSSAFNLTQEQKRLVLKLRYFQLITRGAIPEINAFLAYVFGDGVAYVTDSLTMKMRYIFTVPLPSALELVLQSYDILPRPAGVGVSYAIIGEADGWGFGRYRQNFNNGNFWHGTPLQLVYLTDENDVQLTDESGYYLTGYING